MYTFWQEVQTAFRLILLTMLACCLLYPALVLGFAMLAVPDQRQGSLIRDDFGKVVGSRLIAQKFTKPEYFWPRPSAVDYDAMGSGGSNLSPAGIQLRKEVLQRLQILGVTKSNPCPVELVTASGSGLDPHLTLSGAKFQIPRIAKARGLSENKILEILENHAQEGLNSWFGLDSLVNTLEINLLLDDIQRAMGR